MADQTQLEYCLQNVIEQWSDLDILVNNAEISIFSPITETTVEAFTGLYGPTCVRYPSRSDSWTGSDNGTGLAYGRIINLRYTHNGL